MNAGDARIPRNAMILISLAQGLFLLLLWRVINDEFWPYATPAVNFPLWAVALTLPTFLLFTLERSGVGRLVAKVAGIVGALAVLAVYVGWQASPHGAFMVESLIGTSVATLVLASFCALLLLQASMRERQERDGLSHKGARSVGFLRRRLLAEDYAALFAAAWRNVLVGLLSALVAAGVALLLTLWGALFRVVGIDFFAELFAKDWFLFPVLSVAFGLGVFIFRSLDSVLGGIVALVEGLMRLLLPLGLAVVVIFLATLPFTGLAPLWETGNGTALLLWLNALALVFVNGVYQTGATNPYPRLVHLALTPGVALLPIISVLGMVGLYLRVAQYGWSVERCWAALVAAILLLVSLGYSGGVFWRREQWPSTLKQTNVAFLLGLLLMMLLVNTPVLDFRVIATESQFGRLESGESSVEEVDFEYAAEHLARPGHLAMQALAETVEGDDPEQAARMRAFWSRGDPNGEGFWAAVTYRPEEFAVPPDLAPMIEEAARELSIGAHNAMLARVQLSESDHPEYLLLDANARPPRHFYGLCFYRAEDGWRRADIVNPRAFDGSQPAQPPPLRLAPIAVVEPPPRKFKMLDVGGLRLAVEEPVEER